VKRFLVPLLFLVLAAPAATQTDPPIRRVVVEVGGGILGGAALGSADANLRANATTKQPYRLFSTSTRITPARSVHLRVGFALNRRFAVEGGAVFSRPAIRTSLSADVEGAPAVAVDERVDQYFIETSLLVRLDEIRLGSRTIPFLAGGAGYLRQLHQGLTFIEEGHFYHLGGGVKHWLLARDRGFVRAAGLRADGRVYVLVSGISFDGRSRPHAAVSGSFFLAF
jgi:hypothetical protein